MRQVLGERRSLGLVDEFRIASKTTRCRWSSSERLRSTPKIEVVDGRAEEELAHIVDRLRPGVGEASRCPRNGPLQQAELPDRRSRSRRLNCMASRCRGSGRAASRRIDVGVERTDQVLAREHADSSDRECSCWRAAVPARGSPAASRGSGCCYCMVEKFSSAPAGGAARHVRETSARLPASE